MPTFFFHFSESFLPFRLPELDSLLLLAGIAPQDAYDAAADPPDLTRPYMLLQLPSAEAAVRVARRGILVTAAYEVWGDGRSYRSCIARVRRSLGRAGVAFDRAAGAVSPRAAAAAADGEEEEGEAEAAAEEAAEEEVVARGAAAAAAAAVVVAAAGGPPLPSTGLLAWSLTSGSSPATAQAAPPSSTSRSSLPRATRHLPPTRALRARALRALRARWARRARRARLQHAKLNAPMHGSALTSPPSSTVQKTPSAPRRA